MTPNELHYISLDSRVYVYDSIKWFEKWLVALWRDNKGGVLAFTFVRRPSPGREREYKECFPFDVEAPWLFVVFGKPDEVLGVDETNAFLHELSTRKVVINADSE